MIICNDCINPDYPSEGQQLCEGCPRARLRLAGEQLKEEVDALINRIMPSAEAIANIGKQLVFEVKPIFDSYLQGLIRAIEQEEKDKMAQLIPDDWNPPDDSYSMNEVRGLDPRDYALDESEVSEIDAEHQRLEALLNEYFDVFGASFPLMVYIARYRDKPLQEVMHRIQSAIDINEPVDYYAEMAAWGWEVSNEQGE